MHQPNIISAGKMMAYVLTLFGIMQCGATFAPYFQEGIAGLEPELFRNMLFYSFMCGGVLIISGVLLTVMFGKAAKSPDFGSPILILGTFVAIYGILSVAFMYRNPFSWMIAILCLAIFIDALCLKLSIDQNKKEKAAK